MFEIRLDDHFTKWNILFAEDFGEYDTVHQLKSLEAHEPKALKGRLKGRFIYCIASIT